MELFRCRPTWCWSGVSQFRRRANFMRRRSFLCLCFRIFFRRFLTTLAIHTPSFLPQAEAGNCSPIGVSLVERHAIETGMEKWRGNTASREVSRNARFGLREPLGGLEIHSHRDTLYLWLQCSLDRRHGMVHTIVNVNQREVFHGICTTAGKSPSFRTCRRCPGW